MQEQQENLSYIPNNFANSPEHPEKQTGFTTPRSIKTVKRLKKLQDAPSLTNSLDFTGTNESTPKRQKKCKGRDCTPEFQEKEISHDTSSFALQSSFTALLNQSDSMKKSCFQLLNPLTETSARDAFQRLDTIPEGCTIEPQFNNLPPVAAIPTPPLSLFEATAKYKEDLREMNYQISGMMIRLYFFTYNQRSEALGKLFIPDCPFEVIGEESHTFQYTMQCLSQAITNFELDETTLEFMYVDENTPWVMTCSGKAITMDGTALTFTQSFKIAPKSKGIPIGAPLAMESVLENYTIIHTKIMINSN